MNPYTEHPGLALAALEKIAEEIPSGVSALDMGEVVTKLGTCPTEIHESITKSISEELKNNIRVFWEAQNVEEKLETIKGLERRDDNVRLAMSQEEVMNAINAKYLKLTKEGLLARIKKTQEENACLEKVLKEKAAMVKRQMDAVKKCDFML